MKVAAKADVAAMAEPNAIPLSARLNDFLLRLRCPGLQPLMLEELGEVSPLGKTLLHHLLEQLCCRPRRSTAARRLRQLEKALLRMEREAVMALLDTKDSLGVSARAAGGVMLCFGGGNAKEMQHKLREALALGREEVTRYYSLEQWLEPVKSACPTLPGLAAVLMGGHSECLQYLMEEAEKAGREEMLRRQVVYTLIELFTKDRNYLYYYDTVERRITFLEGERQWKVALPELLRGLSLEERHMQILHPGTGRSLLHRPLPVEAVEYFAKQGAAVHVNTADRGGMVPFVAWCVGSGRMYNEMDAFHAMMEHGMTVPENCPSLAMSCCRVAHGLAAAVAAGCDVTVKDQVGRGILKYALNLTPEVIEAVVEAGFDLGATDVLGHETLSQAARTYYEDYPQKEALGVLCMEKLLDLGADAAAVDGRGRSVLSFATRRMLPMLVDAGADPGQKCEDYGLNGSAVFPFHQRLFSLEPPQLEALFVPEVLTAIITPYDSGNLCILGFVTRGSLLVRRKLCEWLIEKGASIDGLEGALPPLACALPFADVRDLFLPSRRRLPPFGGLPKRVREKYDDEAQAMYEARSKMGMLSKRAV